MDAPQKPLVSIIAISYNHAPFIREALESVFGQTYAPIEIIIADDHSTDNSLQLIEEACTGREITIISNTNNRGNCKTFNDAFKSAKGSYIIDFALDDRMYPDRVAKQVALFERGEPSMGVVFTNTDIIDEVGTFLYNQYPRFHHRLASVSVPEGDVFKDVLSRYYINPVGMMFRREVIEHLNGYDESLAYEDFDFWIRSSRIFTYTYLPEILSSKRLVPHSLSFNFYKKNKEHLFASTLTVCKKAWWLCKNEVELKALVHRCRYELKQCIQYGYTGISKEYLEILKETDRYYFLYNGIVRCRMWFIR
ncbi:MAG: glycosyltransferase family 2 protein [Cytophagales bacterium]|nr:glycosyltransferase family 2 protein [Cytophaga sp.]